jgi:hypothetical protein
MKVIRKYRLNKTLGTSITLPVGSKILSIQNQSEQVVMWALVDLSVEKTETRRIERFVTGFDQIRNTDYEKAGMEYISTVQFSGGNFVLHFFEIKNFIS